MRKRKGHSHWRMGEFSGMGWEAQRGAKMNRHHCWYLLSEQLSTSIQRWVADNTIPDSSCHSLCRINLFSSNYPEGHFGGDPKKTGARGEALRLVRRHASGARRNRRQHGRQLRPQGRSLWPWKAVRGCDTVARTTNDKEQSRTTGCAPDSGPFQSHTRDRARALTTHIHTYHTSAP
jgi:hypothetical protein